MLVNINVTSPFTLALKVSALAGAVVTAPIWLYQLWAFIVPGLLAKEKKWALIFIGAATPLFAAGVVVGYFVMPKGIAVLLSFTQDGVSNLQDINDYLSFLLRVMVVFGIAFLIPLLVLMLNIIGVIKAKQLSKYRTLVIFGTFVFGAVATPSTDPFSMLALAAPMTVLFLAAEVIAHILDRRKARRAPASDLVVVATASSDRQERCRRARATDADDPRVSRASIRAGGQPLVGQGSGPGAAAPGGRRRCATAAHDLEILLSRDFDEAAGDGRRRPSPTASTCWP